MKCQHCGAPLPGSGHMNQGDPLPELRIGSVVVTKRAEGIGDQGERGVVYEAYESRGHPGWSVIFQSGRHEGFSLCDVDFFLEVTGEVCEELTGYTFENVVRLALDFAHGAFMQALEEDESLTIYEQWFGNEK